MCVHGYTIEGGHDVKYGLELRRKGCALAPNVPINLNSRHFRVYNLLMKYIL